MTTPWDLPHERVAHAVRDLLVASDAFRTAIARHHGMVGNDILAVSHLAATGPMTPTALATALRLTGATVTSLVDRLESDGMVTRRQHPSDRRRSLVELTPLAHERVIGMRITLGEVVADMGDGDVLVPVLSQLSARLHDAAAELAARSPVEG